MTAFTYITQPDRKFFHPAARYVLTYFYNYVLSVFICNVQQLTCDTIINKIKIVFINFYIL